MKKSIVAGILVGLLVVACGGGHRGGGNKPPGGTGKPGGGNPPGALRMSATELHDRQIRLAQALGSSRDPAAAWCLQRARGGHPSLAQLPVGYWDADLAFRAAREGDPSAKAWFSDWIYQRTHTCDGKNWMCAPSGSQNHSWAQVFGEYASYVVLGPELFRQRGGKGNPVAVMDAFLDGTWPCCGSGHNQWAGEIVGSRHYSVRSISDQWACADLCEPALAAKAQRNMDRVVLFLAGKVRPDGVWPEDSIPQVRAERDNLCAWPAAPFQATKYPFLTKHPSFTPHSSLLLIDYVDFLPDSAHPGAQPNTDFIGHYRKSACRDRNPPDWCGHLGGQGAYPDECDESGEANNLGLLICGVKADGTPGWLPKRSVQ